MIWTANGQLQKQKEETVHKTVRVEIHICKHTELNNKMIRNDL